MNVSEDEIIFRSKGEDRMEDMALLEKKRKKERENWWKKILAYYMMQKSFWAVPGTNTVRRTRASA